MLYIKTGMDYHFISMIPIAQWKSIRHQSKVFKFFFAYWMENKSYFGNSEKFWPFGLYEGHKAKKGQKQNFGK